MGTLYGNRSYQSIDDIYNDIGDKLIFSIEDDLDYTIAKDPILYSRYLETVTRFMGSIDETYIDRIFDKTEEELKTFYNSYSVISQSQYDTDFTSKDRWQLNMKEKKDLIKNRLISIRQTLQNQ